MKRTLRRKMRATLRSMDPEIRHQKALQASRRLIASPVWDRARSVFVYLSMEHEIDTTPLVDAAWRDGKAVLAPKAGSARGEMSPVAIRSWGDCLPGHRGILEPFDDRPFDVDRIDLVVVPGLAFDHRGHRLGHGAGCYDRFLARQGLRAYRCGFAFEEQVLERLTVETHDQAMHGIVTDTSHREIT